jgi:hypothetical protein
LKVFAILKVGFGNTNNSKHPKYWANIKVGHTQTRADLIVLALARAVVMALEAE